MTRAFKPVRGTLDNEVVEFHGNWAIGATGAVGAQVGARGCGLSRSGTGTYVVQLAGLNGASARVPFILAAHPRVVTSDADPSNDTDAIEARVLSFSASAGTVTFQTYDEAGVVRDPASGAYIMLSLYCSLSQSTR
jgi:hypothetical protein